VSKNPPSNHIWFGNSNKSRPSLLWRNKIIAGHIDMSKDGGDEQLISNGGLNRLLQKEMK
jgi:hypothetical protein